MKFPTDLVNRYGAKAGILMYVADKLPDIPQCKMIVKTPDESIDDALERAEKAGIGYPRLLRSSAIAELDGYEGVFPTYKSESKYNEKELINKIQKSPQKIKKSILQDTRTCLITFL